MMIMSSSDPLLQPFQLRHLRLRNRIVFGASSHHDTALPGPRFRAGPPRTEPAAVRLGSVGLGHPVESSPRGIQTRIAPASRFAQT
jgi:hypothetical protein